MTPQSCTIKVPRKMKATDIALLQKICDQVIVPTIAKLFSEEK